MRDRCAVLLIIISFFQLLREALTNDLCEDGTSCPPPNLCCEEKCCLLYETGKEFSPIYRLSLWNAWYFWFIVIFILISCFGGCGYWRRRHLHFVSTSFHRERCGGLYRGRCGSLTPIQETIQDDSGNDSSRPPRRFIPMSNTFQNPPPYNEVTSKPDMYPLVQGGHDLKHESLAFVYATTPFFHSYLPYNSGAIGLFLSSPAESNSSSLFQSNAASNYMYPPPYSDGIYAHPSVSTPGSMLSACTPTEHSLTTHFMSSTSPPMATTPTSQQILSEVTTPADSLATSPSAFGFYHHQGDSQLPADPFSRQAGHLFANLVADIQQMTNQMMVSPASTPGSMGRLTPENEAGVGGSMETPDSARAEYGSSAAATVTSPEVSGGGSGQWPAAAAATGTMGACRGDLSLPSLTSVLTGSSVTWPSPTVPCGQRSTGVNEGTNTSPVGGQENDTNDENSDLRLFQQRSGAQQ